MKSFNAFGWLAEVIIPRADRCAGFFLYEPDSVRLMSAHGRRNEFALMSDTDQDLKDRLRAPGQLREGGVAVWEDTPWGKAADMMADADRCMYMLMRIPKPEDPVKELERELSRCASAMLMPSSEYGGTSNNIMNNYSGPAMLLCMPSNLAALSRYAVLSAFGFTVEGMPLMDRYSNAGSVEPPTPPVDGFSPQDWFVMQDAVLPLSHYGRTHDSSYGSAALELPWLVRVMFSMLRNRTYYVLLSCGSGTRNMTMRVLLPASSEMESLDGMAALADRLVLTRYSGGSESFHYGHAYERTYSGMRVCASGAKTITVDNEMSMLYKFMRSNYYNADNILFESDAWGANDANVSAVLRENREPGGAAWYGREQSGQDRDIVKQR